MAAVQIESVHPLDASLGLPLQTQIHVVFNQLMDEATITTSTFLISGPDESTWSGPDLQLWDQVPPEEILSTTTGEDFIEGAISFSQEMIGGNPVTKAVFTPTTPLRADTKYVIYLAGDEGLDPDVATPITALDSTKLVGTYVWNFSTGSGSVQEVPTTSSSDVSAPPQVSSAVAEEFLLSTTIPTDQATNLDISTDTITLNFNTEVDATTVDSAISIVADSVNGDMTIPSAGTVTFTSNTVGKVVTLTLTTSLLENNVVEVTIGNSIADCGGDFLSTIDPSFYFTTTYSPLYVTARRIRLDIGAHIVGIPTDTINLAIFEASRTADILSSEGTITNQAYFELIKRNFVICEASGILLNGVAAQGNISAKKLGDFSVSYDTKYLPNLLDRLAECVDKWQPLLMSGGDVKEHTIAVKGLFDPNRPELGRIWEKGGRIVPAANTKESYFYRWRKTWEPRT